jgi:hemolysin III
VVLVVLWACALVGTIIKLIWIAAPPWLIAGVYVAAGWLGASTMPQLVASGGLAPALLILAGGLLYTIGAIVFARGRPDPWPSVFGFHEIFHVLVVVAAAVHFTAIAVFVIPRG